jgi:hypothetical protein
VPPEENVRHKSRESRLNPSLFDSGRPLITTAPVYYVRPILFSRKQAALAAGICTRSLDAIISRGEIATKMIGSRRLIIVESLETYCQSRH